jgi:hypothetical protein
MMGNLSAAVHSNEEKSDGSGSGKDAIRISQISIRRRKIMRSAQLN